MDRTLKKCMDPWYQYLIIFCVAAFFLTTIFVLHKSPIKNSFNKLYFIKGFFKDEESRENLLVAATGNDPESSVAVQFETSRYFLVVRRSGGKYEYFSNTQFEGNAMREFIRQQNIKAVIAGTMDIRTFQMLNSVQVDIFTGVTGRVEDAVKTYKKGRLVSYSRYYKNRR